MFRIIFLIFIILILIPSDIFTQNSQNLCTKINKNEKCNGKFSFECRTGKCSVDKTSCDYFKKLGFSLGSFFTSLSSQQYKLRKYQKFTSQIKQCPEIKTESKPENICLRKMNCFSFTFYAVFNNQSFRECQCIGKNSYSCGKRFCTADKNGCEYFKKKIVQHKIKLNQINNC